MSLSTVALISLLGCSSPTAPTRETVTATALETTALRYPAELADVIAFLDADPWLHPLLGGQRLGEYVRTHVREIALRPQPDTGYAGVNSLDRPEVIFNTVHFHSLTVALKVGLLLHEARHLELRRGHTCPNGWADRSMEEGGAIAVHVEYLEHAGVQDAADWYRRFAVGC